MIKNNIDFNLDAILKEYQESFCIKEYPDENNDTDILMEIFGITPEMKRKNRQYWGRELGMCWQKLIIEICSTYCCDFRPAIKIGSDEPYDLLLGEYAIDTKYRIGSGDSGTLKKFKAYAPKLKEMGYKPLILILRNDNLPAAIQACITGGWEVLTGIDSMNFIKKMSSFDLTFFMQSRKDRFKIIP